jgi:hypothetical protein
MPVLLDTPERIDSAYVTSVDLHQRTIERPATRKAKASIWRTLVSRLTAYLSPTPSKQHTPSSLVPRPFEAPMDRIAREYPSLSAHALAIF